MDIEDLQKQIEMLTNTVNDLKRRLDQLSDNTALPVGLEHALSDRGFWKFEGPVTTPAFEGDTVSFQVDGNGFRTSYGGTQGPAIPFRFIKLPKNYPGSIAEMYIPLYIFGDATAD